MSRLRAKYLTFRYVPGGKFYRNFRFSANISVTENTGINFTDSFLSKKKFTYSGGKLVTLVKGEKTLLSPPAKFHPLYGAHAHTHTSS